MSNYGVPEAPAGRPHPHRLRHVLIACSVGLVAIAAVAAAGAAVVFHKAGGAQGVSNTISSVSNTGVVTTSTSGGGMTTTVAGHRLALQPHSPVGQVALNCTTKALSGVLQLNTTATPHAILDEFTGLHAFLHNPAAQASAGREAQNCVQNSGLSKKDQQLALQYVTVQDLGLLHVPGYQAQPLPTASQLIGYGTQTEQGVIACATPFATAAQGNPSLIFQALFGGGGRALATADLNKILDCSATKVPQGALGLVSTFGGPRIQQLVNQNAAAAVAKANTKTGVHL